MHHTSRNRYENAEHLRDEIAKGRHRDVIGGFWDEIGDLQLQLLIARGLKPHHTLLDVGCGALRCGVKIVPYLEPGNYFGIDLRSDLIDAGYEREIVPSGLAERLPRANLIANDTFDARCFGQNFDFAIALSVFTHIPWNDIRVCLEALSAVMKPGGCFLPTFFPLADGTPSLDPLKHEPGGIVTYGNRDPYHYRAADIAHACKGLPWILESHGGWSHPRGQHIMQLRFGAVPG
jgi:SAM-dependent methyltransferase